MTDAEAARRITADGIDILDELKGYTKGARTGIAARRPAPVQVSFFPLASYGLPLPASRRQSRPPHPGQGKPAKKSAWTSTRNCPYTKANWQFPTKGVRFNLNRIYIQFE
jgi:hypothetical protein